MKNDYRALQLINTAIGPVAAGAAMPLGVQNRSVAQVPKCQNTFNVSTTANNVVYLNEAGFWEIKYNASLVAAAAGLLTVNLQVNGVTVATSSVTATAAGDTVPVSITYITRAFSNCGDLPTNLPLPINAQLATGSVAITDGSSTMQFQRTYKVNNN